MLRAAEERLVPIMMTVLSTGLALIPLVAAGSIPGQEIEHPMALVILGGLITATLLNLFVVPSLTSWFAKPRRERGTRAAAGRGRRSVRRRNQGRPVDPPTSEAETSGPSSVSAERGTNRAVPPTGFEPALPPERAAC